MTKKLFISADIEGTCGIAHWQETNTNNEYSDYFRTQMTNEVAAVCKGALRAGFEEIIVKDAHDSARNIYPDKLPSGVKIIRGWAKNPYIMMAGLDVSFDAAIYTGYHSGASVNGNPLSHTMNSSLIHSLRINGVLASEFTMNSYTASYLGVPSVMLTGDKALCESAKELIGLIKTVAVSEGTGNCSLSMHPHAACELIEATAFEALSGDYKKVIEPMPEKFEIEVVYKNHHDAYYASFFPGAYAIDSVTTGYTSSDYMDVMKFFLFVL